MADHINHFFKQWGFNQGSVLGGRLALRLEIEMVDRSTGARVTLEELHEVMKRALTLSGVGGAFQVIGLHHPGCPIQEGDFHTSLETCTCQTLEVVAEYQDDQDAQTFH